MKQTNERGYSFEIDESLTQYAQEDKPNGNKIQKGLSKNIVVLKITKEDKFFGYILFDTKIQKPLSQEMGLEAMACKIDIMRFLNESWKKE